MSRYVSFRDFDWVLLIFVLLICALGVMEIRSATMHTKFAGSHLKQIYWVVAGVGMMFLMSLVNYQALQTLQDVSAAAHSIKELADYLQRNPSAVVRGRDFSQD